MYVVYSFAKKSYKGQKFIDSVRLSCAQPTGNSCTPNQWYRSKAETSKMCLLWHGIHLWADLDHDRRVDGSNASYQYLQQELLGINDRKVPSKLARIVERLHD